MRSEALEQIEKIKNLDKDIVSRTLLDSVSLIWSLNNIIEYETTFYATSDLDNIKSSSCYEELKECIYELGDRISDSYLDTRYGDSFSRDLLEYLGFDRNDDLTVDVIEEYCMASEKERDLERLKQKLIECVYDIESSKGKG